MNEKTNVKADQQEVESVEVGLEVDKESKALGAKEPREIGGPKGPEPTRYGDWESKGRCYDF